jgi:hypothetical protein
MNQTHGDVVSRTICMLYVCCELICMILQDELVEKLVLIE